LKSVKRNTKGRNFIKLPKISYNPKRNLSLTVNSASRVLLMGAMIKVGSIFSGKDIII
jgi:hypothetical protein